MSEVCSLCERRRQEREQLCVFHTTAFKNLQYGYKMWQVAFGEMEREKYYSRLEKQSDTGLAVREVIKFLQRR